MELEEGRSGGTSPALVLLAVLVVLGALGGAAYYLLYLGK